MSRSGSLRTVVAWAASVLLMSLVAAPVAAQDIVLRSDVVASGATNAGSSSYGLRGTTGQAAVGIGSSNSYAGQGGFWYTGDPDSTGNDPPVARADTFATPEGQTLVVDAPGVLGNDSDPNSDPLTAQLVSGVSNGTLNLSGDGSLDYTPNGGFTGTDTFTYEAIDDSSAADTAAVTIEVESDSSLTRSISLLAGWNLLSIPLEAPDPTFGGVLPACTTGFAFMPGAGYNVIASGDVVPVGDGFWAYCAAGTAQVSGTAVDTPSVPVRQGWNIVGALEDPIAVGAVTSQPPGIVQSSFYGFEAVLGYQVPDTLRPGHGYWVRAGEDGTLDLSGDTTATARAKGVRAEASATNGAPETGVALRVRDASGASATLHLVRNASEARLKQNRLPPRPPGETFDVRFASGRSMAVVRKGATDGHAIEMQGLELPVDLELDASADDAIVRVVPSDGQTLRLTPDAPSITLQSVPGRLDVGLETVPASLTLHKSAPNPAVQRATIGYAVPEETNVAIAVYDVLGRRVARLVDDVVPAGRHQVQFEASTVPSGTYFVRMQAGSVTKTRRLVVVR